MDPPDPFGAFVPHDRLRLSGIPGGPLSGLRFAAKDVFDIAGLAGLPQVSLPLGRIAGCPVGLSLIAQAGRDGKLLCLAERIADAYSS